MRFVDHARGLASNPISAIGSRNEHDPNPAKNRERTSSFDCGSPSRAIMNCMNSLPVRFGPLALMTC